jgi:hypothetical protein
MRTTAGLLFALLFSSVATESHAVSIANNQVYLFSEWSSPPNATDAGFGFTGTDGVILTLNPSGVATSATDIASNFISEVDIQLYYAAHASTIDSGEGYIWASYGCATLACYVNKEIGRLDDAGLVNEGTPTDAKLNIDFSNDASVTLRIPESGIVDLWIFEDAGLDPFKLSYCADISCGSPQTLFNGFNTGTGNNILGRPDFGSDDYAPPYDIDQAFYFLFDKPLSTGFLRLKETDNYGSSNNSTKLEVDFIGSGTPVSRVPEPASFLLLGIGLVGLAAWRVVLRGRQTGQQRV